MTKQTKPKSRRAKPKTLTREEAIKELTATRALHTGLLKPLNIHFESFLALSQIPKVQADAVIDRLIGRLGPIRLSGGTEPKPVKALGLASDLRTTGSVPDGFAVNK